MTDQMRFDLCEGKYTYVLTADYKQYALRYGEEWRDLAGDKFVLALASELHEARAELAAANANADGIMREALQWKDERDTARAELAARDARLSDIASAARQGMQQGDNGGSPLAALEYIYQTARIDALNGDANEPR